MEMHQLAESIVQITAKAPTQNRLSQSNNAVFASAQQESIYKNRPYLLMEKGKHLK